MTAAYTIREDFEHDYSFLDGPDGWVCFLGEPEDCVWWRDGAPAVTRLNEQHEEIQRLQALASKYAEMLDNLGLLEEEE